MLKRLFKSTFLFAFIGILSCGNQNKKKQTSEEIALNNRKQPAVEEIILAANRTEAYLPLLENKKPPIAKPKKIPMSRTQTGIWLPFMSQERSHFM